jgi:hypothetical protein
MPDSSGESSYADRTGRVPQSARILHCVSLALAGYALNYLGQVETKDIEHCTKRPLAGPGASIVEHGVSCQLYGCCICRSCEKRGTCHTV